MSLRTETSSYNMRYILHLINVYVIEDVPFCPGLVGTVVKLIQDKILTMQLPADVTLVAFDVLMDFVDLYDFVKRDSKNVARELVLALSRYVDTLITAGRLTQTYPLIVQAYDCMTKWILVSQWIIDDRDCYKAVIATLSKGITIFDRDTTPAVPVEPVNVEKKKRRDTSFQPTKQLFQLPPRVNKNHHQQQQQQQDTSNAVSRTQSTVHKKEEMAVRMAAEYCMSQFVNQFGRFWLPSEHALGGCRSAMVDDVYQLKQLRERQKKGDLTEDDTCIRSFLIDRKTILTFINITNRIPRADHVKNVPAVIVVIRDTTGKYVWSMQAQYRDPYAAIMVESPLEITSKHLNLPSHVHLERKKSKKAVHVPSTVAVNEREIPKIDKIFIPESEVWNQWESVKKLMDRQEKSEAEHIRLKKEPNRSFETKETGPNIDSTHPTGFRLLLAQLGFLLPKNRGHITPLHVSDAIISEMETLDMLNEYVY